ncbi:two-component system sensor histidine kinase BaeS [Deinococcus sp. HSC-46F16]|uniref:ATP-binding protein n=1 Tax=Deinococcus sp. HSC-46F16 TaxID=2910968 RepID=UPI0020A094CF|nr:ATP-binding protein [Deinococcus sp. HSC-46F16]MCP2014635.1 two-component system sensor histidine kinase BaeS [Deinococcus sp. HSC-46F16]
MTRPRAAPRWRAPSLAVTLLLSMLLAVGLAVGAMFLFSDLAVRREVARLPPEVQTYLREREQAVRRGEEPPPPPSPPGRASVAAPSPGTGEAVLDPGVVGGASAGRPRGTGLPAALNPRNRSFVRDVQGSLVEGGLVAAGLAAVLSLWLARRVARPLGAVTAAATRLAAGDLSARAPQLPGDREVAELARTFNDMAGNLEILERERRQAIADIAHELRTPIAIMQARLDALEDGVYPLEPQQVALLSAQTQLLTRLVGDLRTLTLADAGRLGLQPLPVDLAEVAAQVVRDLGDRAAARGIELRLSAQPTPLVADRDRVQQVTANLVDNALRHARQRVELQVEPCGGQATLHVDDDGPGIPDDLRQAVFARFTRLDESRTRDTGGSGLGLAIVQALAGAHGGQARAAASPLGGARFSIYLPSEPGGR